MADLFAARSAEREEVVPGAVLLRGFAEAAMLLPLIDAITQAAPFRRMLTPGGGRMQAALSACGSAGWVSDKRGYRYSATDPDTGRPWPAMPAAMRSFAQDAAAAAGYPGFDPDSCMLNRYGAGCGMGAHRDADEADFRHPIVSVSLGQPARFRFYGTMRGGRGLPVLLEHGDVLVFGGPARLRYHAVSPPAKGDFPGLGPLRLNLTFRRAV